MSHQIHQPAPPDLIEGQQGEELHTIIGQDPWLEEFARSPWDPMNSYRATGRLTGLAARRIFRRGWMKVAAFLIGLVLVGGSLGFTTVTVVSGMPVKGMISVNLESLLISVPGAIVGVRLILHAVRS